MRQKIMAVALVAIMGVALAGCQTPSGYYDPGASAAAGMVGGAAGGAALGSIIGAATGHPGAGAWIGAASGAGAGALVGSIYARDQNQNLARSQAAQGAPPPGNGPGNGPGYGPENGPAYGPGNGPGNGPGYGPGNAPGYGPGMGNAVAIDQAYVQPNLARPGSQIMLTMNYRVMTPQNQPVPVQLVREISKDGQLIAQPYQETRQVQSGAYGARVGYNLAPGIPPGDYVVTFRIMSSLGTSEKSVYFSVQ